METFTKILIVLALIGLAPLVLLLYVECYKGIKETLEEMKKWKNLEN